MSSPNIVFLDTDTVEPDSIDMSPLTAFTPAIRFLNIGQEPIPQHAAEAEIIITNKVPIDEVVFQELPNLKLICVAATGTNNIDLLAAERRNIKVKNVTGYSTDSVAQHVMASILHLTNHMQKMAATANQWPQAQQFCMFPPTTYELAQKTLGIVGVGAIGNRVAKIAKSFGMRVLLAERKECASRAGRTNFEQVIAESDVLTMHCPLTVETRNLI